MNIEKILRKKYGKYIDMLYIVDKGDYIVLDTIIIDDEFRGSGVGSKIMNDLIKYADNENKIIVLTPSSDFGGNVNNLIKFYKKFGFVFNKGRNKDFRFMYKMIRYPKMDERVDKIPGGLSDGMTLSDIAKHHNISIKELSKQLEKGIKVELEHTNDPKIAKEIAYDHLFEDPKYYDKLEKVEESTRKDMIRNLLYEHIKLNIIDETPDSHTYKIYYNNRNAGKIICGPASINSFDNKTHEIIGFRLKKQYANINIAKQVITSLWLKHPKTKRFIIHIEEHVRDFWEKLGFIKLNDYYYYILRGQ